MAKGLKSAYSAHTICDLKNRLHHALRRGYYCPILMRADFACQLRPAFGRPVVVTIETVSIWNWTRRNQLSVGFQNNSFPRAHWIISSELSACSIHLSRRMVSNSSSIEGNVSPTCISTLVQVTFLLEEFFKIDKWN